MAFAAARSQATMSDINITPLVDVMLVLLVIFMVTAPMLDFRMGLTLPQQPKKTPPPPETLVLTVAPGDMFLLAGVAMTPAQLQGALAEWRGLKPDGVLKIDVNPEADYQSAATAMATANRAGIENLGLVEP
jgi:biopolymer transport protein ExbD